MRNSLIIQSNSSNYQIFSDKKPLNCNGIADINSYMTDNYPEKAHDYKNYINRYLSASIKSRAKDYAQVLDKKMCQLLCTVYVISNHIKSFDKSSFATNETLVREYNNAASSFCVGQVASSTFGKLLTQAYSLGLIANVRHNVTNPLYQRYLAVNLQVFAQKFKGAFNLAVSHAKRKTTILNTIEADKLQSSPVDNLCETDVKDGIEIFSAQNRGPSRSDTANPHLSIENIELAENEFSKQRTIRSKNISNRYINKNLNRSTGRKFDFSVFKQDSKLAEQLQVKARTKTATSKDLSDLVCLHIMHNVKISRAWHGFLRRLAHLNSIKNDFEAKASDIFLKAFPMAAKTI